MISISHSKPWFIPVRLSNAIGQPIIHSFSNLSSSSNSNLNFKFNCISFDSSGTKTVYNNNNLTNFSLVRVPTHDMYMFGCDKTSSAIIKNNITKPFIFDSKCVSIMSFMCDQMITPYVVTVNVVDNGPDDIFAVKYLRSSVKNNAIEWSHETSYVSGQTAVSITSVPIKKKNYISYNENGAPNESMFERK